MLERPPAAVIDAARQALAHAKDTGTALDAAVAEVATRVATGLIIDTDAWADTFRINRPGVDNIERTLAWAALGGAPGEGWLSTMPAPVAAAAPAPSDEFADLYVALYDELDAYLRAVAVSAIAKLSARVRNDAGRLEAKAAAPRRAPELIAEKPWLATQTLRLEMPAIAAALTAEQDGLLRRLIDEHRPQILAILERSWRRFLTAVAAVTGRSVAELAEATRDEHDRATQAAVGLAIARMQFYAAAVLDGRDETIEETPDGVVFHPPASITTSTIAVLAGAAIVGSSGNLPDISAPVGAPVVLTNSGGQWIGETGTSANGGIWGPVAQDSWTGILEPPRLVHTWVHRTGAGAFEPHKALDGLPLPDLGNGDGPDWFNEALQADPNEFPYVAQYRPNTHPAGSDHAGCRCITSTTLTFADSVPSDTATINAVTEVAG